MTTATVKTFNVFHSAYSVLTHVATVKATWVDAMNWCMAVAYSQRMDGDFFIVDGDMTVEQYMSKPQGQGSQSGMDYL